MARFTRTNLPQEKPENIDLRLGDFVDVLQDVPDGTVDCIITDPPYPKEYLDEWTKLSHVAHRILKPNGFCITYSGKMFLLEVLNRMSENLTYYWTFALYHRGQVSICRGTNLIDRWKPILIFQNGRKRIKNTVQDYFVSQQREKDGHYWQQSVSGVLYIVKKFTKVGDIVCDPFFGAGTTAIACHRLDRKFIGAEIDRQTFNVANMIIKRHLQRPRGFFKESELNDVVLKTLF